MSADFCKQSLEAPSWFRTQTYPFMGPYPTGFGTKCLLKIGVWVSVSPFYVVRMEDTQRSYFSVQPVNLFHVKTKVVLIGLFLTSM